jgi:hypothetical protein
MNFPNEVHLPFVYTMTHFLQITMHISLKNMTHNLKNVINGILFFTIHAIFLWPYFLDAVINIFFIHILYFHPKCNLFIVSSHIATHITPYLRHYMSFTQDSSTHTPSYVIKAGLGTPNIHKVYIHGTKTTLPRGQGEELTVRGAYVCMKK